MTGPAPSVAWYGLPLPRRLRRGGGRHESCALPGNELEGKGPKRRPQKRSDRRLEEVAKAVGGGYCRLQMPLKPALGVRGTVAGHRRGALEGAGGYLPAFQCIPGLAPPLSPRPHGRARPPGPLGDRHISNPSTLGTAKSVHKSVYNIRCLW